MKKNVAVILAAGRGTRLQSDTPKQFLELKGKPVLLHAVQRFQESNLIDEILIVTHPSYINNVKEMVATTYPKVKEVIAGGVMRYHSTWAAIQYYNSDAAINLIFHDAARPCINSNTIDQVVQQLLHYNAVVVAIPATDTLYKVNVENQTIDQIPDRNQFYQAQTPQAFDLQLIKDVFNQGMKDDTFNPTDDVSVVKRYAPTQSIAIVEGCQSNKKITYLEDLLFFENLLQKN